MTEKNITNITVTDVIGNEYQSWKPHDKVFISSPTGTGKTYFILKVLLPYVCQQRKKILYLVNRRILKEQLENELSRYSFELKDQIKVELYQTIEMNISNIKYDLRVGMHHVFGYQSLPKSYEYDYVVCDECHYFLADSNYNTNTGLSFRWIQDLFSAKIRIFLSATICDIKRYIIEDDEKRRFNRTPCYGFHGKNTIGQTVPAKGNEWNYDTVCNYDYLDIHIINKKDEISDLVVNGRGKWLIFVDDIGFGKKLQTELVTKWKQLNEERDKDSESVVMLSSDYENTQDSAQEVNYIRKDNKQSAKVLISTSVMDNGINLKDILLRNIILIADTEVEFIQMLGRKRKDGERVNIYIYRQSQEHFLNRLYKIKKMKDIAEDYLHDAKKYVEEPLLRMIEYKGYIADFELENLENRFIADKHLQIMQDIGRQQIDINDVNSVFNICNGVWFLNLLSFRQIEILVQYYYKILDSFDLDGEDAFLKEQLHWLGKSDVEIEDIIGKSKVSREETCRQAVCDKFNEFEGIVLGKEEAIALKKDIRDDLLILVQCVEEHSNEKDKVIDALKKNDRPISRENMEFLKKFCNLPFAMVVEKASNSSGKAGKQASTYMVQRIVE